MEISFFLFNIFLLQLDGGENVFYNDNPILSCFYFLYSSRSTGFAFLFRGREWFGVEGFSIIIFCVIMIIFFSFWEIVYVCSQKSTPKVKFIFFVSANTIGKCIYPFSLWVCLRVKVEKQAKWKQCRWKTFHFFYYLLGSKNMKIESWFNFTQQLFLFCAEREFPFAIHIASSSLRFVS